MGLKNNWFVYLLVIALTFALIKQCESEPKVVTKTKVIYKTKTDTIHTVEIKEVPKTVIVEKIKTIKGKDSIIYVDRKTDTSIEANQYDTELKANNALAKLKITTTGQLLDVSGTISWTEKETQTTTTITKPKSGLFIYGQTSVSPLLEVSAIGIDYQFKNTAIIGTSFSLDRMTKQNYLNLKVGFRVL